MKISDIWDREKLFREVFLLAKVKRNKQQYEDLTESALNVFQRADNSLIKSPLEEYLTNLDLEELKVIKTVMYIGRDRDYRDNESFQERYDYMWNYLNRKGWGTKELEVEILCGKTPLDDYLEEGCQILGFRIAI
ncbi:hypothetical protein ACIQLG_03910 [Terribacillus saccharophilus]|uniref:hypothetical protein n=1 Tax=Terribacillus saccharophilus TaxID=361277 RepID=UPI00381E1C3E